jgi:dTDP-4-amino-4,6-dideoxygalactose transaminase
VAAAITDRTRAVSVMNYGGVGVDLPRIRGIAEEHGLPVIEDNAHGLGARSRGRTLGTGGDLAIQSFHDTKNVHSGEGGALVVNRADLMERAEIVRQKGTDRSKFLRGQVDKYTLVDLGSGFAMSELSAALLTGQLEDFDVVQTRRLELWSTFRDRLSIWAGEHGAELMSPGEADEHPAHVFFLLLPDAIQRPAMLDHLSRNGVIGTFHYVPLHSSPGGMRLGRTSGDCAGATSFAERIVRLPLWPGLTDDDVEHVIDAVTSFRIGSAG